MSVSDTDVKAIYTGDAVTTTFAIPFAFQANSEIQVYLRDETVPAAVTETLKTITTHYTLTGGPPVTNVEMITAPTATQKLMVRRQVALTQSLDLSPTGVLSPVALETAYDKLCLLVQQLDEKIKRAIKLPITTANGEEDFPEAGADDIIKWNAAGTALEGKTFAELGGTAVTLAPTDGVYGVTFSPSGVSIGIAWSDALDYVESYLENRFASAENVATTGTPITSLSSTKSVVHFTGATTTEIQGVASGLVSKRVLLWNRSTAAVTLKHQDAGATAANRIVTPSAGDVTINANWAVELTYDAASSRWFVSNPGVAGSSSLIDNTTVISDVTDTTIKIAFDAAGTTGTKTTLTMSQTANRVLTFPDATDTLVGKATTDIMTNKSMSDSTFFVVDSGDNSKKLAFQISGVTTATTRTWTVPDSDDTFVGKSTTDLLLNKSMSDSSFFIVDNGDTSKRASFQASGITASNNRVITLLDVDGFNALSDAALTSGSIPFIDASGRLDEDNTYLTWNNTTKTLKVGDPGTEAAGINIGGVTYESTLKVSDIDGTNYAQTILHRHSTTLEPLIVGARSNSNTSSHAAVTAGQNVFSIYGVGTAGTNYKIFGVISIAASASGTISDTSAPGKMTFSLSPDASVTPAAVLTLEQDKSATFAGSVSTENFLNVKQITTPANPSATYHRIYPKSNNKWYTLNSAGTETELGSGGGGASPILNWLKTGGNSPTSDVYSSDLVELFEAALAQELYTSFKVPDSYVAGNPIKIKVINTTPDTSGTVLLTGVSTLLAKNTTAFNSTTNQRTSTNAAATVSATANAVTETILDITSSIGEINAVAVAAGDLIKVKLTRGTDTATSDVRFHPNMYEVTLS